MLNPILATFVIALTGASANAQSALYNPQLGVYYMSPVTVPSAAEIQAYQQWQQAQIQYAMQEQQQRAQQQQQMMQMMAGAVPSLFSSMGGGGSAASRNLASASPAAVPSGSPAAAAPASSANPASSAASPPSPSGSAGTPQAKGANPAQTSQPSNNPNDCNIVMDCTKHTVTANVSGTALNESIDCGKDTAEDRDYNGKGHLGKPMSAPLVGSSGNSTEMDITGIDGMGTCGGSTGADGAISSKVIHVRPSGAAPGGSGGPGNSGKGSLGCLHVSQTIMSALETSCIGSSFTIQGATDPKTVAPPPPSCEGSSNSGSSGDAGGAAVPD